MVASLSMFAVAAKTKIKTVPPVNAAIEVTASLTDALKAVEEVAADPVVYGTYVYERDKTLTGAHEADSSSALASAFGKEVSEGTILYKVVDGVLAPRHFKEAEDSGTITVRYVVRAVNPATVSIRVDAVFVESARRAVHASEGAVESAEFGQIQQHLSRIQARENEAQEEAREEAREAAGVKEKTDHVATEGAPAASVPPAPASEPAPSLPAASMPAASVPEPRRPAAEEAAAPAGSVAELEQRVNQLRREVEARVKLPGAALKAAPFHTATTIQTVPGEAEVAIVILTPYWYGVQTIDGHTGWIQRSQLEALP
jgi:hypothetical protein